ncbi:hypothetical protein AAFF_G00390780 [Aldrovandia affinis]|uniref:Uncharacterized protein n=1 Tax=Aldrovandia affinis TaxID=143900 RepID=A0AAD7VYW9_9TELE|nr:hypothetical protein AAFF_G00390780 [Aldrovandia affinis]
MRCGWHRKLHVHSRLHTIGKRRRRAEEEEEKEDEAGGPQQEAATEIEEEAGPSTIPKKRRRAEEEEEEEKEDEPGSARRKLSFGGSGRGSIFRFIKFPDSIENCLDEYRKFQEGARACLLLCPPGRPPPLLRDGARACLPLNLSDVLLSQSDLWL